MRGGIGIVLIAAATAALAARLAGQPGPQVPARLGDAPYTPAGDLAGNWTFVPNPKLPNVLILGDSISIGYTRDVRRLLSAEANVFRPMDLPGDGAVNCGDTMMGLKHIHEWLGNTRWQVIHCNWGLHDLCYRNPDSKLYGHRDKIHGTLSVPLSQYTSNLERLAGTLQQTGAKVIWAATTKVPEGEAGRFQGDEVKYNAAAAAVMQRHHIPVDDLWSLTNTFPAAWFREPGDVHYTPQGYDRIAQQVASSIRMALGELSAPAR